MTAERHKACLDRLVIVIFCQPAKNRLPPLSSRPFVATFHISCSVSMHPLLLDQMQCSRPWSRLGPPLGRAARLSAVLTMATSAGSASAKSLSSYPPKVQARCLLKPTPCMPRQHRSPATARGPTHSPFVLMSAINRLCQQAVLDYLQDNPMTVTSSAMQYDADPTTPLPACVLGLLPADVLPDSTSSSDARSHLARVIAGLLFAACGGLDQAHNLVTPLCWGSWTPYGGEG